MYSGGDMDKVRELQEAVLLLQSHSTLREPATVAGSTGNMIARAFPGNRFPTSCMHEFISPAAGSAAATDAFIGGLLHTFLPPGNFYLWVQQHNLVFTPAFTQFGIRPDKLIFVTVRNDREALWVMEEGLKCASLTAVIGEVRELGFTESRRLQLAAEKAGVTGFVHRHCPRTTNVTASVSRWQITPLPSVTEKGFPGLGFPRWSAQLLKARNGKPSHWDLEWTPEGFRSGSVPAAQPSVHWRKQQTG
ncbi:MAG: Error-prone repair protein ImuA [Chitinophagaceae bacterium]